MPPQSRIQTTPPAKLLWLPRPAFPGALVTHPMLLMLSLSLSLSPNILWSPGGNRQCQLNLDVPPLGTHNMLKDVFATYQNLFLIASKYWHIKNLVYVKMLSNLWMIWQMNVFGHNAFFYPLPVFRLFGIYHSLFLFSSSSSTSSSFFSSLFPPYSSPTHTPLLFFFFLFCPGIFSQLISNADNINTTTWMTQYTISHSTSRRLFIVVMWKRGKRGLGGP